MLALTATNLQELNNLCQVYAAMHYIVNNTTNTEYKVVPLAQHC